MLDDLVLERALGDAADEIAVPECGPERILAARDATAPTRRRAAFETRRRQTAGAADRGPAKVAAVRRRPLRIAAVVIASCSLVGVVAGVASNGGGGSQASSTGPAHASSGAAPANAPLQKGADSAATPAAAGTGGALEGSAGSFTPAAPNLVPGSAQAKVIKNGSVTLQVPSVESTVSRLGQMAAGADGYISSDSMSVPGGTEASSADVTVRVPESGFEAFASQVEGLGKPSQVTMSGQDVTSQYADLKARLQALQSTITQLELIETRAQSIGDILAVEQQISDQQSQADQVQGQINVLSDETSYGSLSVHLVGPQKKAAVAAAPPSGISKAWDHARHSFAHGVEAVLGALGGVAVFLLFAGILLGLAGLGWSALRRRLV